MELIREETDSLGMAVVVRVSKNEALKKDSFSGLVETPVLLEDIYLEMKQQSWLGELNVG